MNQSIVNPSQFVKRNSLEGTVIDESERTRSGVSVEEFNRVVNMNISLMRMIEKDYHPIKDSVGYL